MKYRKRPVVVEATQWWKNGDHPDDGPADREGLVVRFFRRPDVPGSRPCRNCEPRNVPVTMHEHGWIDTPEGGHIVCPGDFIITGVQGERYPCKAGIFQATYEPVDTSMSGVERIAAERRRQVEAEGWTPEHDRAHPNGELVDAAVAYARYGNDPRFAHDPPMCWPWAPKWWKPCDRIRALEKAGALIAAEIDRLLAAANG